MRDDADNTVFKYPLPGGDRPGARPTPGRRAIEAEPARASSNQVRPEPSSTVGASQRQTNGLDLIRFSTSSGLNPLVNAAATLLAVFDKTRGAMRHPDVAGLHRRLAAEIREFDQKTRDLGIKPEIALAARYLLCSVVDEAVLHTPWGDQSAWGQRTLLRIYHGETSGGEKSFLILERLLQSPAENVDILELFYICLSLGFEGKYRLVNRGRDHLELLRDNLYRTIRNQRGDFERSLSPSWRGLGHVRKNLAEYVPMWVVASVFCALLLSGFAGFSYWMRMQSDPVLEKLEQLTVEPVSTPRLSSVNRSSSVGGN